jgi:hypothetical protein
MTMSTSAFVPFVIMGLVSLAMPAATLICLIVAYRRLLALGRRLDRAEAAGDDPEAGRGEPARTGQFTILRLMGLIAAVAVVFGLVRALGYYSFFLISLINLAATVATLVFAVLLMQGLRPAKLEGKINRVLRKPEDDIGGG